MEATCHYCDRPIFSGSLCRIHYRRWRDLVRSHRKHYTQGDWDDCWEWKGSRNQLGYGRFAWKFPEIERSSTGNRKRITASRASLLIFYGPTFTTELEACHTCDNPICVNPYHLVWGTHEQNMSGYRG